MYERTATGLAPEIVHFNEGRGSANAGGGGGDGDDDIVIRR